MNMLALMTTVHQAVQHPTAHSVYLPSIKTTWTLATCISIPMSLCGAGSSVAELLVQI